MAFCISTGPVEEIRLKGKRNGRTQTYQSTVCYQTAPGKDGQTVWVPVWSRGRSVAGSIAECVAQRIAAKLKMLYREGVVPGEVVQMKPDGTPFILLSRDYLYEDPPPVPPTVTPEEWAEYDR